MARQRVTHEWWPSACELFELFTSETVLAEVYQEELGLPGRLVDTSHIAFAVCYELDYLVTWNCSHIANGAVIRRLIQANQRLGRFTPLIVTPDELAEPGVGEEP